MVARKTLTLIGTALLGGCSVHTGTTEGLSSGKLGALVEKITARQGFAAVKVNCPSGVPLASGRVSYCQAQYANGESASFLVRQTDGSGDVRAAPATMTAPAIEHAIAAAFGHLQVTVTAHCPANVAIVVGRRFSCVAGDGQHTAKLPVKITDALGGYVFGASARR